jgi:PAS domain-containing protein
VVRVRDLTSWYQIACFSQNCTNIRYTTNYKIPAHSQGEGLYKTNMPLILFHAQMLDAVGEAVIASNLDGKIQYWNHTAEQLFQWGVEGVMGMDILETINSRATSQHPKKSCRIETRVKPGKANPKSNAKMAPTFGLMSEIRQSS